MSGRREPAVAGRFYAADPTTLADQVDDLLNGAGATISRTRPELVIAPHAALRFSGAVAAQAYRLVAEQRTEVHRVVLIGPAHTMAVAGMAVPRAGSWSTPLGTVPLDEAGQDRLAERADVAVDDRPHEAEHCLEVQLPFLQRILGEFRLLPVLVGRSDPHAVADVIDQEWGGPETLVVISTDLSHYEDQRSAARHDRSTVDAVLCARGDEIGRHDACGALPLRGALHSLDRRRLRPELVGLATSGDHNGDPSVVGYGAFVAGTSPPLSDQDGELLTALARRSIGARLHEKRSFTVDLARVPPALTRAAASFVSLHRDGRLLGCIGSLEPRHPLAVGVMAHTLGAAFDDPRLPAITPEDEAAMELEVSVLTDLTKLLVPDLATLRTRLEPGRDGVVVRTGGRRATLLPSVWGQLPDAEAFVSALWRKAGLAADAWPADLEILRYRTQTFS